MPNREKVMQALRRCIYDQDPGQTKKEIISCSECPYYHGCTHDLMRDALALLKEQEPRVLSRSEAESYSEVADGYSEKNPLYVESKKPRPYNLKWATNEIVGAWMSDFEISRDYGIDFRFWTARPTEEQRKAATW